MHKAPQGPGESQARKLSAIVTLEAHRDVLILHARRAFLRLLLEGARLVTTDDARGCVELPEGIDARYFGAVPGLLARAGIIRHAGYVKSDRPEAHARPIALWELVDRDKAARWLADHPAPGPVRERQGELFEGFGE